MAALTDSENELSIGDGVFMMGNILPLLVQSAFFGILVVITCGTVHYLLQRPTQTRSGICAGLIVICIIMLMMSTLELAADIFWFSVQAANSDLQASMDQELSLRAIYLVEYIRIWMGNLQILVADAVVIWRTNVLWRGSWVLIFPCILWTAALGMVVTERTIFLTSGSMEANMNASNSIILISLLTLNEAASALSLATNGVCTLVVAYKTWQYRKHTKPFTGHSSASPVEGVLILLLESGLIFFVFLALAVLLPQPDTYGPYFLATTIYDKVAQQIFAMYPIAVIGLIELQKSVHARMESTIKSLNAPDIGLSSDVVYRENIGSEEEAIERHSREVDEEPALQGRQRSSVEDEIQEVRRSEEHV